ncbi:MAG TPA: ATP-binding cassette domain-containing protein, partial [Chloroflexi bacterium]|nr:ATP-binding cassette domain-containing protein [Chloroflexota bacterium]
MSNGRPLLEVQDIYSGYQADFDIIKGVSLHVKPGEVVCVIGPNGAGKSTVFKALYGFLKVRQGRVLFD